MQEQVRVWTALQNLTTKRREAMGASTEAGSAPVRINDRSLMEQELEARRMFDTFIVNFLAASRAKLVECSADIEAAREVAKERLRVAGYSDPVEGQDVAGSYTSRMIRRHPIVRDAQQRQNGLNLFIKGHDASRQKNLRWAKTLAGKLDRLKAEAPAPNHP